MSSPQILWTGEDGGGERTLRLQGIGGLSIVGGPISDSRNVRTISAKTVTVVNDVHQRRRIEATDVHMDAQDSADIYLWPATTQFISHILRGGQFAFQYDWTNTLDTTVATTPLAEDDTSITVASTTGLTVGEWIYLENSEDATRNELKRVKAIPGAITLHSGVNYAYPVGSIVRGEQYFPKCVLVPGTLRFEEQDAGKGINLWDLRFTFQEVKS